MIEDTPLAPPSDLGPYRREDYESLVDSPPVRAHPGEVLSESASLDSSPDRGLSPLAAAPRDRALVGWPGAPGSPGCLLGRALGGPAGCDLRVGRAAGDRPGDDRGGSRPARGGPFPGIGPARPGGNSASTPGAASASTGSSNPASGRSNSWSTSRAASWWPCRAGPTTSLRPWTRSGWNSRSSGSRSTTS